jgi:hypothetical protein
MRCSKRPTLIVVAAVNELLHRRDMFNCSNATRNSLAQRSLSKQDECHAIW